MTSLPLMYSTAILGQNNLFLRTLMRILRFLRTFMRILRKKKKMGDRGAPKTRVKFVISHWWVSSRLLFVKLVGLGPCIVKSVCWKFVIGKMAIAWI